METLAIYLHWPYCESKCPYCDFASRVDSHRDPDQWEEGCARELSYYAALLPQRCVSSVYFGGGTPSLIPAKTLGRLLRHIGDSWPVAGDVEITLEANPASSQASAFAAFRQAGIGRLSLGVQALSDQGLQFLGRIHSAAQAREALTCALQLFPSVSFDLMYGRAGQSVQAWQDELGQALAFQARHMSLYQLTLEPGTPFHKLSQTAPVTASQEATAQMYETTLKIMAQAGLPQYEVSNFAAPGCQSRHNLAYWRYDEYIGLGPSAHGRYLAQGQRWAVANDPNPRAWFEKTQGCGCGQARCEALSYEAARVEAVMMGLRLVEGVDVMALERKLGQPLALPQAKCQRLIQEGLLSQTGQRLRALPEGMKRLDSVLAYLLA